jgi:hypothetical protein
MSWRVAKSLLTLRAQVDAMAPSRSKAADGTIGDTAHSARKSDHNPNANNVVTAMDITHDPASGVDAGALAEMLRLSKDPRIKYIISNRRICSSLQSPWQWREYTGSNAHTKHVHVSVSADPALYDDTKPWTIDNVARIQTPPVVSGALTRCVDITATVFGGRGDPNNSAYDNHFITDDEFGVALPDRITASPRPKVRVTHSQTRRSVVCDIVDVGPWNIDDPYWERGSRPQAESGTDMTGRRTNSAGIDLTPGAARAIGLDGKGKVEWEFVSGVASGPVVSAGIVVPTSPSPGTPAPGPRSDVALGVLAELFKRLRTKPGGITMPTSESDLGAVLQQVMKVLQGVEQQRAAGDGATTTPQQQAEQIQQVIQLVGMIAQAAGKSQILGQVNGALGETLGKLLDGKKTAIGIIGSALTALLSAVPPGSGLGQVLAMLTPAAGLSGFTLPIFIAMTAWGVLGKMEKWAGNSPQT